MFIFGYAKALKEATEENKKLKQEIERLTQKVNKQKQELKNSTYKWK